jgi:hypothetical protein
MKNEDPIKLREMIEQFIIDVAHPDRVPPKPRAARGSRKKRDHITLSKNDLERMLSIARLAGDREMIAKLTPKKSLTQLKKDLISSVRRLEVDQELWNSYVEAVAMQNNPPAESAAANLIANLANATEASRLIPGLNS